MSIKPQRRSRLLFALLALCALLLPLVSVQALAQNFDFSPGVKSPYDTIGSAPSLATFNGKVYAAFRSNDTRNVLYIASSTDGVNFGAARAYPQFTMGSAPSLAVFNNRLYVGFQANDSGHVLYITSSANGVDFNAASGKSNVQMGSAPSLAAFNGRLFVAFKANDAGNAVWVANSTDGNSFASTYYGNVMQTKAAPSLAAFNGRLYLAQLANDDRNILYVTSAGDGFNFPVPTAYPGITMGSAPSLGVAGGSLYVAFKSSDASNKLFVTASSSGSNFPAARGYDGIRMGGQPSAAGFNNTLSIGFRANDAGNAFFVTRNNTGSTGGGGGGDGSGDGNGGGAQWNGLTNVRIANATRGRWSDAQVYYAIIGRSNNQFVWVDNNGNLVPMKVSDNGALSKNGVTYTNYFRSIAQKSNITIPAIDSARLLISVGSPMYIRVNQDINGNIGYAGANIGNPSDPNQDVYFDFGEFAILPKNPANQGIYINTTRVDQFGFPLKLQVQGLANYDRTVGEPLTETRDQIYAAYQREVPNEFKSLAQTYRITAPGQAGFNTGGPNANYLAGYIDQIWNQYRNQDLVLNLQGIGTVRGRISGDTFRFTGGNQNGVYYINRKPTTGETLLGAGAFNDPAGAAPQDIGTQLQIQAQLSAALNRHVAGNSADWYNAPAFYPAGQVANWYAKFWHSHSIKGLAYGFPYDDVGGFSSSLHTVAPTNVIYTVGW